MCSSPYAPPQRGGKDDSPTTAPETGNPGTVHGDAAAPAPPPSGGGTATDVKTPASSGGCAISPGASLSGLSLALATLFGTLVVRRRRRS
jgi:hypothetical protein